MANDLHQDVADAIAAVDGTETLPRHEAMAEAAIALVEANDDDEEDDTETVWRNLALQFDGNRIEARAILNAVAEGHDMRDRAAEFLRRPPLSGEKVLAQRIAEMAVARTMVQPFDRKVNEGKPQEDA